MRNPLLDYRRDWRRWSRAERVAAILLALVLVLGTSAVLVKTASSPLGLSAAGLLVSGARS